MKIEKLTENKIRIIITIEELERKNIDIISLSKNNDAAKKIYKKILSQAEKEVGFHFQNSQILIEAFIEANEFFVLVFTKIPYKKMQKIQHTKKGKNKSNIYKKQNTIYQFDQFDDFYDFCTYIKNNTKIEINNLAKNIFLYEYKNKYYLILIDANINSKMYIKFHTYINEFAYTINNIIASQGKISEYGKLIFKNNALNKALKLLS